MLEGKVAIVTGGGTGIGAAVAALFARNGAKVVITSELAVEAMQAVVDKIVANGGSATALTCDVTDRAAIARLVAAVDERFGRIDFLINCAGVCFWGPLEVGSSRVDLQACKLEYSIVSPK